MLVGRLILTHDEAVPHWNEGSKGCIPYKKREKKTADSSIYSFSTMLICNDIVLVQGSIYISITLLLFNTLCIV